MAIGNKLHIANPRLVSGGGAFNPLTIVSSQFAVWADDPGWIKPVDGATVASWLLDGAVVPTEVTQSTESKKPIYDAVNPAFNDKATVNFDGVDDFLEAASVGTTNDYKTVIVARMTAPTEGSNQVIWGMGANLNRWVGLEATSNVWKVHSSGTPIVSAVAADSDPHLIYIERLNSGTDKLFLDGVEIGSAATINGSSILCLGAAVNTAGTETSFGACEIAFLGSYNHTRDITALIAGLTSYYGL